jgi:hypothetical protein
MFARVLFRSHENDLDNVIAAITKWRQEGVDDFIHLSLSYVPNPFYFLLLLIRLHCRLINSSISM